MLPRGEKPLADSPPFQSDSDPTSPLMAGVTSMAAGDYQRANAWSGQLFAERLTGKID